MTMTMVKYMSKRQFRFSDSDLKRLNDFVSCVNSESNKKQPYRLPNTSPLNVTKVFNEVLSKYTSGEIKLDGLDTQDMIDLVLSDGLLNHLGISQNDCIEAISLFSSMFSFLKLPSKTTHGDSMRLVNTYSAMMNSILDFYDAPYFWGTKQDDAVVNTYLSFLVRGTQNPYTIEIAKKDAVFCGYANRHRYTEQKALNIGVVLARQGIIRTLYVGDMDYINSAEIERYWNDYAELVYARSAYYDSLYDDLHYGD